MYKCVCHRLPTQGMKSCFCASIKKNVENDNSFKDNTSPTSDFTSANGADDENQMSEPFAHLLRQKSCVREALFDDPLKLQLSFFLQRKRVLVKDLIWMTRKTLRKLRKCIKMSYSRSLICIFPKHWKFCLTILFRWKSLLRIKISISLKLLRPLMEMFSELDSLKIW